MQSNKFKYIDLNKVGLRLAPHERTEEWFNLCMFCEKEKDFSDLEESFYCYLNGSKYDAPLYELFEDLNVIVHGTIDSNMNRIYAYVSGVRPQI